MRHPLTHRALRTIIVTSCLLFLCAGAAFGQAAAGYSEYFLPGDEQNMYFIFNDLDTNAGATGMHSVTSVVAWSANTTVYYDHWENGYNFDPNNPAATADETYTLATPGTIKVFESSNVPNIRNAASTCAGQTNPGNRCYDGGDRVYVAGGPVTVTRAMWMEARGAGNQGDAWEIYPVKPQLTTYVLPFGEDNFATDTNFFTGFERVYALIQATDDNTTVTVDLNHDGAPDILNLNRDATWNNAGDGTTVTLQKGETFLLDRVSACSLHVTCTTFPGGGPLNSGAVINGNKTLQVKYVAGRIAQTYAARGLSAFPRGFWTNDYYAPFSQAANANAGVTDYYLFNPNATPLTINWQSQTTSGSFAIPGNSSQSYNRAIGANPSVPVGSGLYFSATSPFWGVGFGDSTSQGTPTGQAFEWGFSLLPTTFLYKEHFMGWSPGSLPLNTAPTNGNGVFLTVGQDNTQVFVDYNNDGTPDVTYTLNRLQSQFVPPGPTGALDGARFYATGLFSMSYGENADTATTPTPNLDLGYVALPATDFVSLVLTTSKSANPAVVSTASGSTTSFTIKANTQAYNVDGVTVVDTMPPNWQFVPGFTTITKPDLTVTNSAAAAGTVTTNGTTAVVGTGTTFTALTAGNPITIAGIGYTIQSITDNTHLTLATTAPAAAGQTYFVAGAGNEPVITGAGTAGNPYVLTWSTAKTGGAFLPNQQVTITFRAATTSAFANGTLSQNNVVSSATRTVGNSPPVSQTFTATDFAYVASGSVSITKASSVPAATPLFPGDTFTYTTTVTNPASAGTNPLTGIAIYDSLPAGLSMVAGTTSLNRSTVGDSFNSQAYTLNVGTRNWAGNWTEAGDTGGGATNGSAVQGDVQIVGTELRLDNANSTQMTISRAVNLTGATNARLSFRYRTDTGVDAADVFSILGGTAGVGGAFGTTIGTITGITGATTGTASFDITGLINANTAIRFTFPAGSYQGATEFIYIDDVSITFDVAVAVAGNNPPDILSSSSLYTLVGGQSLTATNTVQVNNPFPSGQTSVTNTSFTSSVQLPIQLASNPVTNIVATPTVLAATVAGRLWLDADADAIQDIGEPGIDNVIVTLKDQFGTPVASATTDSNGRFIFSGVAPGNGYYVEATTSGNPNGLPPGLTQSAPIGNTNNRTAVFNLSAGQNYNQADLGYAASSSTAAFGDQAWVDANGNGLRDPGEVGLGGVVIKLYRDTNGNGVLNVGVDALVDTLVFGTGTVSATNGSTAIVGTGTTFTTLQNGDTISISGTTYTVNTVTDNTHLNLTANFTGTTGAGLAYKIPTTTASDGSYLFSGISPATGVETYFVVARTPAGYTLTTPTPGSPNVTFKYTSVFGGASFLSADYGYLPPGGTTFSYKDRIFKDTVFSTGPGTVSATNGSNAVVGTGTTFKNNNIGDAFEIAGVGYTIATITDDTHLTLTTNYAQATGAGKAYKSFGTFDNTESGIGGVSVEILDSSLNVIGTTITAADGTFTFSGMTGGGADYTIKITDTTGVLTNFIGTSSYAIADQRLVSNLVASIDRSATPSFGFTVSRSIGDTVFNDLNGNGFQDAGEPGIAGVTVRIAKDANANGIIDLAAGAGTVTATNGSPTVTGAGTTFLNYHAGEPIAIAGTGYIIQSIASNTSLTLTTNYGQATGAGKAFTANPAGAGTVATTAASNVVTGTGTAFLTDFKVNDTININGTDFVVQSIASNTSMNLTTNAAATAAGLAYRAPVFFGVVTTDANGKYLFSGLANGSYIVSVQNPASFNYIGADIGTVQATNASAAVVGTGTAFTKFVAGETITITTAGVNATYTILSITDDTHLTLSTNFAQATGAGKVYGRPDSDAVSLGAQLGATVTAAGSVLDRDFAFQVPAASQRAITGKLWNDADKNGVIGNTESGLSGVTLDIIPIATGPGTLSVTNGVNSVVGTGTTFTQYSPGNVITIAGVPYTISGITDDTHLTLTVLYRGATAAGLAYQRGGAAIETATTDANGFYTFTGLANSSYVVKVTDTNGNVVGFGATSEKTEGLISGPNPGNAMEVMDLTTSPGTAATTNGSPNVVGTGTTFVSNYKPNDPILIGGVLFTILSVTDNTHLVLTSNAGTTAAGQAISSPDVDFGFALLSSIPTLVKLTSFDAQQDGADVLLQWHTSFENDNLGFNIYRIVGGTTTKINEHLIAGTAFITKGHPKSGHSYRFTDKLPSANTFAQYTLEDVDTHGKSKTNGPYTTRLVHNGDEFTSQPPSPTLHNMVTSDPLLVPADGIGAVQPSTLPTPTAAQISQQLDNADTAGLKISITKEGWYRLTASAMTAAGFTPPTDAKKLALFCDGIKLPIVINGSQGNKFGPNDSIEFYALGLDTALTASRTYWLRIDHNTEQLTTNKGGGGSPASSVLFTFKRSDRTLLASGLTGTGDGGDNFFGPLITTQPISQDLTVANLDPAGGNASLQIVIQGGTDSIQHQVRVEIRGQLLGTAILDNVELKSFSYSFPQSYLANGANALTLTSLNTDDDVSILASATLTYQHLLKADNGLLEVKVAGSQQLTVDGFTNSTIRALDITDPFAPRGLDVTVTPVSGAFRATFTAPASATPRTVVVFSSDRILTPAAGSLTLNATSHWSDPHGRQADLIIITNSAFTAAANTLKSVRDAGGTLTNVVDVEDIYDEYNFGIDSQEAIRSFLSSTRTWSRAPKYVLLLGDASIDPRNYLGLGAFNFVPTRLVPTVYFNAPSDDWFTDFNSDTIPDLAIGRIPVKTAADANTVINKIATRTTPLTTSSQNAVLIADVPETFDFETEAAVAKTLLPPSFNVQTINIGATPTAHNDIVTAFNAGPVLVDYMGHGSVEIWSFDLFNSNDASALTNSAHQPFVMAMTCLNGYFHDLYSESLATALLTSPNGGAVAVWASSTLTEPYPQFQMNKELLRQLFGATPVTIGDAVRAAKQATQDLDVRRSWLLFGDPSMKLTK
ncbi:MAG: hypothetical protein JO093_07655 [Acidobacteria bacterium]|nr:hypothetical protein [Acidobacteriota bacterium]MBV9185480.1 hypothetical protein [Acidobacteriota bacterium]